MVIFLIHLMIKFLTTHQSCQNRGWMAECFWGKYIKRGVFCCNTSYILLFSNNAINSLEKGIQCINSGRTMKPSAIHNLSPYLLIGNVVYVLWCVCVYELLFPPLIFLCVLLCPSIYNVWHYVSHKSETMNVWVQKSQWSEVSIAHSTVLLSENERQPQGSNLLFKKYIIKD